MNPLEAFVKAVSGATTPGGFCNLRKWGGMDRASLIERLSWRVTDRHITWEKIESAAGKAGVGLGFLSMAQEIAGIAPTNKVSIAHNVLNWGLIRKGVK